MELAVVFVVLTASHHRPNLSNSNLVDDDPQRAMQLDPPNPVSWTINKRVTEVLCSSRRAWWAMALM